MQPVLLLLPQGWLRFDWECSRSCSGILHTDWLPFHFELIENVVPPTRFSVISDWKVIEMRPPRFDSQCSRSCSGLSPRLVFFQLRLEFNWECGAPPCLFPFISDWNLIENAADAKQNWVFSRSCYQFPPADFLVVHCGLPQSSSLSFSIRIALNDSDSALRCLRVVSFSFQLQLNSKSVRLCSALPQSSFLLGWIGSWLEGHQKLLCAARAVLCSFQLEFI